MVDCSAFRKGGTRSLIKNQYLSNDYNLYKKKYRLLFFLLKRYLDVFVTQQILRNFPQSLSLKSLYNSRRGNYRSQNVIAL